MDRLVELGRKIAKICDWTFDENLGQMFFVKDGDIVGYDWPSLDAMYEAEETLQGSDESFDIYAKQLGEYSIHANVLQRAEAFVAINCE